MRVIIVFLWLLFGALAPAAAQLSLSFNVPGLSIGVNVPVYPQLVRVPGYPVYYAPALQTNFFFYDGLYWVYQDDDWYASDWYDGPWGRVGPAAVPLYVLRVPVRYYRSPPRHFRGWRGDAPPHWGEHWGNDWQRQRHGWDRWDRNAAPAPAPLPHYQRPYAADRYPQPDQQRDLRERNYRYQPREAVARQHLQGQRAEAAPAPERRHDQRGGPERDQRPGAPAATAPPPRQAQGKPGQGEKEPRGKDQGKGREGADERENDRKK